MSGPSTLALADHHLTEAIRHLIAAAEFVRELTGRIDADDLAKTVERAMESVRDISIDLELCRSRGQIDEPPR